MTIFEREALRFFLAANGAKPEEILVLVPEPGARAAHKEKLEHEDEQPDDWRNEPEDVEL